MKAVWMTLACLALSQSQAVLVRKLPAHALSDESINYINSVQSTWKAGRNFDPSTPMEALKRRLGVHAHAHLHKLPVRKEHELRASSDEPLEETFDARTHWPNCKSIKTIRDQENCGSCWAFAAVEAMSDRVCIHSKQTVQVELSPQDLVTCCRFCGEGCNGGYPSMAWNYWMYFGLVTGGDTGSKQGCRPYDLPPCHGYSCEALTPKCERKCVADYTDKTYKEDRYFGSTSYSIESLNEEAIMREIQTNGPVEASISVYEDFYNYKSGVYQYVSGEYLGGHAVRVLGWGVENNTKYWLIANSWNSDWADLGGFFKMRRGTNECGVEESIAAGLPKL